MVQLIPSSQLLQQSTLPVLVSTKSAKHTLQIRKVYSVFFSLVVYINIELSLRLTANVLQLTLLNYVITFKYGIIYMTAQASDEQPIEHLPNVLVRRWPPSRGILFCCLCWERIERRIRGSTHRRTVFCRRIL